MARSLHAAVRSMYTADDRDTITDFVQAGGQPDRCIIPARNTQATPTEQPDHEPFSAKWRSAAWMCKSDKRRASQWLLDVYTIR